MRRDAVVNERFLDDLRFWTRTNPRVALKVLDLLDATLRDPFEGLGQPERLKNFGPNTWSRHISKADRFIYRVEATQVWFVQARAHYTDR